MLNQSLRARLYLALEPSAREEPGLSVLNWLIVVAVLFSTLLAILETEPLIANGHETIFRIIELSFGVLFVAEYVGRFWAIAEAPTDESSWRLRFQFVFSPSALIDLVVIVATFSPFLTSNIIVLRLLRLARILRLAKLGRMSLAMRRLRQAVHSRRYELGLTMGLAAGLLVLGASALYFIEGDIQPDKFGSIPRALWWAVITMTTIGYGDAYPVTVLGKLVAACVAIAGIGLIAMPTGILAAALSDAMQKEHDK